MLPRHNLEKRSFALAKESGKNAARYFLEKYPNLFHRDDAEPKVEAFTYKEVYDPDMTFTVADLEAAVERREVTNAVIAFEKLREQGQLMDSAVMMDLFKLVSFYNQQDVFQAELVEEMWFTREAPFTKTWKDGGLADQLFAELDSDHPEALSIYLQALARHGSTGKAFELFTKAESEGKLLSLNAYNAILHVIPFIRESGQSRSDLLTDLLKMMSNKQIAPNLTTFNKALAVLSRNPHRKGVRNEAKTFLSEMQALAIRPNLASYSHILKIFYSDRRDMNDTLPKIMEIVKNKTFVYTDQDDRKSVCCLLFFKIGFIDFCFICFFSQILRDCNANL
jgi:pentatricopeptide repeat domain-containing protein 3